MPNLVIYCNWTPTIEWHTILVWLQEQIPKIYVLNEIGLHSQNITTILDSIDLFSFMFIFRGGPI